LLGQRRFLLRRYANAEQQQDRQKSLDLHGVLSPILLEIWIERTSLRRKRRVWIRNNATQKRPAAKRRED